MCRKICKETGLIIFGFHGLTWGLGLWLDGDNVMLDCSVQLWYDKSIPLEEIYSVDMQSSLCKSLGRCLQQPKISIIYTIVVLQSCGWSTMPNDV